MKTCYFWILFLSLIGGRISAEVPGDINGNGTVDIDDIAILSNQWLGTPGQPSADIAPATPDGDINLFDFSMVASHWLLTAPDPNEMSYIPGGEFQMGDLLEEGQADELPVHSVTVNSMYMGKYEVTNSQYCAFLNASFQADSIYVIDHIVYGITGSEPNQPYCSLNGASESLIDFDGELFSVVFKDSFNMSQHPMVCVSWYGAAAYCNWRSEQDGYQTCYDLSTWTCDFTHKGYRLPTEAEWEYAGRGGQSLPYIRFDWGDIIDHDHANYYCYWAGGATEPYYPYDNELAGYHPDWDDGIEPYTSPVGTFSPNTFGLYDLAGNAWEWCNDFYDSDYYTLDPQDNPTGPETGPNHVIRGGSWDTSAISCRTVNRHVGAPDYTRKTDGFRLCLDLE